MAVQLQKEGILNPFELHTLCNAITLLRANASDLMSVIDRDQPVPYVNLSTILVVATTHLGTFNRATVRIPFVSLCATRFCCL